MSEEGTETFAKRHYVSIPRVIEEAEVTSEMGETTPKVPEDDTEEVKTLPPRVLRKNNSCNTLSQLNMRKNDNIDQDTHNRLNHLFLATTVNRSCALSESNTDTTTSERSSRNRTRTLANKDPKTFFSFFKRTFSRRRNKRETSVKEIHIDPEEGQDKWASRSASGSNDSGNTSRGSSGGTSDRNVKVVHDMRNEYNPEYRQTHITSWS